MRQEKTPRSLQVIKRCDFQDQKDEKIIYKIIKPLITNLLNQLIMKKSLIVLMSIATLLFSSCLKNEEPASLVELRQAKAAYIAAEAAYKTADAALKQAEADYERARVEGKILENQILACSLEIEKINVELAKCSSDVEKAKYEVQLLEQQALIEDAIAALKEAELDALEAIAIAEYEYNEAMKLLEAQKMQLPADQQKVIDAYVAAIKAYRYGGSYNSTPFDDVEVIVTVSDDDALTSLRNQLVEKNAALMEYMYLWDEEVAIKAAMADSAYAVAQIKAMEYKIEKFEEFSSAESVEKVQEIIDETNKAIEDLNDSIEVIKLRDQVLDDQVTALEQQNTAIENKADLIANNTTKLSPDPNDLSYAADDAPSAVIPESEKYVLEQEKQKFIDDFNDVMEEGTFEYVPFELEVDPAIAHTIVSNVIKPVFVDYEATKDPATNYYVVPDDIIVFEDEFKPFNYNKSTQEVSSGDIKAAYVNIKNQFDSKNFFIDPNSMIAINDKIADVEVMFEENTKVDYEAAKAQYDEIVALLPDYKASYKFGFTKDPSQNQRDAQGDAIKIHNDYVDLEYELSLESKVPTDKQMQAYLSAMKSYLSLRQALDGTVAEYNDGVDDKPLTGATLAEFKAGTVTTANFDAAVVTPAELELTFTNGYGWKHEDFAKSGILNRWNKLSEALWGVAGKEVGLDQYVSEDFRLYIISIDPSTATVDFGVANVGDVKNEINSFASGYLTDVPGDDNYLNTSTTLDGALWWKYITEGEEVKVLKEVVTYQEHYQAVKEQLEASIEACDALVEEAEELVEEHKDAVKEQFDVAIAELVAKAEAILEEQDEIDAQIRVIKDQIIALGQETTYYNAMKGAATTAQSTMLAFINKYYDEAYEGTEVSWTDFTANTDVASHIAELVAGLQNEMDELINGTFNTSTGEHSGGLMATLDELRALREGRSDIQVGREKKIAELEAEIEEITAQIIEVQAKIEYYTDLLENALEILVAGGDIDEGEGGEEA